MTGAPDLLFDSQDFNAQALQLTPAAAYGNWTQFLDTNLPKMSTGFVSLEHDLYPLTVALAINYFLPDALGRTNPALNLKSIIECQGKTIADAYAETATTNQLPGGGTTTGNATTPGASSAAVGGTGASSTGTGTAAGTATQAGAASASATATRAAGGAAARVRGGMGVAVGIMAAVVGALSL